jgi:hypothetical protein
MTNFIHEIPNHLIDIDASAEMRKGIETTRSARQIRNSDRIVFLLLDKNCRERAVHLTELAHVWLLDSELNADSVHAPKQTQGGSKTNFLPGSLILFMAHGVEPEDWAISVLQSIDEHHNEFSSIGPYCALVIEATKSSDRVLEVLRELGFVTFRDTHFGLVAEKR